jgi:site-specific recombinase XerD
MTAMSDLAPVLQEFFTRRLISQRDASPATISAYRDTFRLLIVFAAARSGKTPSALGLADLDAPAITAFLQHLQEDRGNSVRTRNARLAAVHSFFAYAALRHPEHGALIQRVLAIPGKRRDRTDVTYLTPGETDALLAACDQSTRTGRRDHAMLALAVQAGLRVSELTGLTCTDIRIQAGSHVHCTGKGRKERDTPLLPATVRILKAWLAERDGQPGDPLFPGPSGQQLSRDAVERRIKLYHARAAAGCPSLAAKHVTVHTLRHSAAMRLLLAGVDITVIALWLGHESLTSTQTYLHADMHQKQEAIEKTAPPGSRQKRYQPPDPLLEFLENL